MSIRRKKPVRQQRWQRQRIDEGRCRQCGDVPETRDGQPMRYCRVCLEIAKRRRDANKKTRP